MIKTPIPVLHEAGDRTGRKPILQFKELDPDWQRYNCWRASLIESYANWLKRWKRLGLDSVKEGETPGYVVVSAPLSLGK